MDEDLARQLIRQKLREGRLPRSRAVNIWAAPGAGQACDGCGMPIAPNEQIVWGIATRDGMSIQFHEDCYQIWDGERLALSDQEPHGHRDQA
jgi:hypothetical protein